MESIIDEKIRKLEKAGILKVNDMKKYDNADVFVYWMAMYYPKHYEVMLKKYQNWARQQVNHVDWLKEE